MPQDVFLITAMDLYEKSEKLADNAYKAYHRLIDQQTNYYAEQLWSLYLLHTSVSESINNRIAAYKLAHGVKEDA